MNRAPTPPLPGSREEDLPPEPGVSPAAEVRRRRPRSPNQVREKIDRHGRPKQRYMREHVFDDGKDILLLKVEGSGHFRRLPEPTPEAPTSGVPRFETRQAANAWLRGDGARSLGGHQVAVVKALDYVFVEVLNIPTTKLVRMPRGANAPTGSGSSRIDPKDREVRKVPVPQNVDPGAS